ncbi:MAG: AAA family ATPase, partial [Nitrospirae bacterium]|nr:AAA family ATPase [Nitrospirota bacterium]
TVVIMTSNLGSAHIQELAGWEEEEMRKRVLEALHAHFRPEFLNRIDDTIIFHTLSRAQLREIVEIQVESLRRRLEEKGITLRLTDAAKDYLASEGYDPTFGARPLKRVIQREVQNPLALKLLEGVFKEGETVAADVKDGRLEFGKES